MRAPRHWPDSISPGGGGMSGLSLNADPLAVPVRTQRAAHCGLRDGKSRSSASFMHVPDLSAFSRSGKVDSLGVWPGRNLGGKEIDDVQPVIG